MVLSQRRKRPRFLMFGSEKRASGNTRRASRVGKLFARTGTSGFGFRKTGKNQSSRMNVFHQSRLQCWFLPVSCFAPNIDRKSMRHTRIPHRRIKTDSTYSHANSEDFSSEHFSYCIAADRAFAVALMIASEVIVALLVASTPRTPCFATMSRVVSAIDE